jgi:hypothetical protein
VTAAAAPQASAAPPVSLEPLLITSFDTSAAGTGARSLLGDVRLDLVLMQPDRYNQIWALSAGPDSFGHLLWTFRGIPGHRPYPHDFTDDGSQELIGGYDILTPDGKLGHGAAAQLGRHLSRLPAGVEPRLRNRRRNLGRPRQPGSDIRSGRAGWGAAGGAQRVQRAEFTGLGRYVRITGAPRSPMSFAEVTVFGTR